MGCIPFFCYAGDQIAVFRLPFVGLSATGCSSMYSSIIVQVIGRFETSCAQLVSIEFLMAHFVQDRPPRRTVATISSYITATVNIRP